MPRDVDTDPRDYLENHLYNELRWLLCAATEWHVQHTINPDDNIPGQHVKLYAMDSAVLHARALFEFFTQPKQRNHLALDLYGLEPITSVRYGDRRSDPALGCWCNPLHAYLMHLQDRTVTQQLTSFDGNSMKGLNRMPVDFAREVVRLWGVFVGELENRRDPLAALAPLARSKLDEAITASARVVTSEINAKHGIGPIAW